MKFDNLANKLNTQISKLDGLVSLSVKFINSGEVFKHNENEQFVAASVIKIPIVCAVYKKLADGFINNNDRYKIQLGNRVDGSGISKLFDSNTAFAIQDLMVLCITISDNSAANQLIDIVGTEFTELHMKAIGLENTALRHKMMIKAGKGPNVTTAEDMVLLLEKLFRKELPGSEQILEIMKHTKLRDRIPDLIPSNVPISHKPGSLPVAMHEVGIIHSEHPFIFCFFSDDQKNKKLTRTVLATCAKLCFDYANPQKKES